MQSTKYKYNPEALDGPSALLGIYFQEHLVTYKYIIHLVTLNLRNQVTSHTDIWIYSYNTYQIIDGQNI